MAPLSSWAPPADVDEYRLVRELGRGEMGQVHLAHDQLLDRRVAIKFISAGRPSDEDRRRVLLEARAVARLQHPNVVAVHRVGEVDGRPYVVSEYVAGKDLAELPHPLPWTRALELGLDMARGLAAAHRQGVLHRDIKPANVRVAEDTGQAKILDFGLATLIDAGVDESTAGTPQYFAPEIFLGEPATTRTDVYALGVVLFELLTGRAPHQAPRADALAYVVTHEDAPRVATLAPDVDPRFAGVVDRALSRDAAARYASAADLREALEQVRPRGAAHDAAAKGEPYRGLTAFRGEHRATFFGRDADARAVVDRLRSEPLVVVTGESGVGKSSLCHAGVAPRVEAGELGGERQWTAVTLVPGTTPMFALASALAGPTELTADQLELDVFTEPREVARALRHAQGQRRGLLLVVDQLEELLVLSDAEIAASFATSLVELVELVPGLKVLCTVRADHISRLAALPRIGDRLGRVLHVLRPLGPDAIRAAIEGPAEVHGFSFDPDASAILQASALTTTSLPLLQFALADIWERRDRDRRRITRAAVEASGGVAGALERHADAVLAALTPEQRRAARALLVSLVSGEGTRVRRRATELELERADVRIAAEALVRGRLLTTGEAEGESTYEVAHEALIAGWGTLRRWLDEDDDARVVRDRVAAAAREWERLGRSSDALWGERQLLDLSRLDETTLADRDRPFVRASRGALRRRAWLRRAALAAIPMALALVYLAVHANAERQLRAQVDARAERARAPTADAARAEAAAEAERAAAFVDFDRGRVDAGEARWATALSLAATGEEHYRTAARELETALLLDPRREDVRATFASVLYARAVAADVEHRWGARDELLRRLELYDRGGELGQRFEAPATLAVTSDPPGATITLLSPSGPPRILTGEAVRLSPGSYVVTLALPGRAEARLPLLIARGEQLSLQVPLPAAIPAGFVYVPAGRFLLGSGEDDGLRKHFLGTVPIHTTTTAAYLIARHETTYADWTNYLDAMSASDRAQRLPKVAARGFNGSLALERDAAGTWRITLQPASTAYSAVAGEPVKYAQRATLAVQDWRQFPVAGVSYDDARAYTAWLAASGRVPGARLCTEKEWERAARGADARTYPHGYALAPADANHDLTYGKDPRGFGPDMVGAHPASTSPFGVDDLAGNVWEWTVSMYDGATGVARGGAYYHDKLAAGSTNRLTPEPTLRDLTLGLRVCADLDLTR